MMKKLVLALGIVALSSSVSALKFWEDAAVEPEHPKTIEEQNTMHSWCKKNPGKTAALAACAVAATGVGASVLWSALKSPEVPPQPSPGNGASQHLDDNCDFCKIIKGTTGSDQIIDQDEDVIAIYKLRARSLADFLIIPKKHIVNIKSLDPRDPFDQTIVSKIAFMAQKLKGSQDFYLRMNNGAGAAQSVFHMHAHIIS